MDIREFWQTVGSFPWLLQLVLGDQPKNGNPCNLGMAFFAHGGWPVWDTVECIDFARLADLPTGDGGGSSVLTVERVGMLEIKRRDRKTGQISSRQTAVEFKQQVDCRFVIFHHHPTRRETPFTRRWVVASQSRQTIGAAMGQLGSMSVDAVVREKRAFRQCRVPGDPESDSILSQEFILQRGPHDPPFLSSYEVWLPDHD